MTNLTAANSTTRLRFGLWFEPEMVNPNSSLYKAHPDWVLAAGPYPRTLRRDQLVLDVARPDVQDFIIDSVTRILASAPPGADGGGGISYVKWDNNRGMHELPAPGADHAYMLGLYRVLDVLTTRFPDVLWEGCASGGGRFDPGALQYFPQMWTSDNTDALARLSIQFGTSLVYPPSTMGAHVSAVPNKQTTRTIPVGFRAHVAMMGGSFGLELGESFLFFVFSFSCLLFRPRVEPPSFRAASEAKSLFNSFSDPSRCYGSPTCTGSSLRNKRMVGKKESRRAQWQIHPKMIPAGLEPATS